VEKTNKGEARYTIEPEWELGGVVFAVYESSAEGMRKERVDTYPSYELAQQRYPAAVRGAVIWPRKRWTRQRSPA